MNTAPYNVERNIAQNIDFLPKTVWEQYFANDFRFKIDAIIRLN